MLENLKKLRIEYEISQEVLANVLGVAQQTINKYEQHITEPDIATLIKLADYFNVSVDYLIGHTTVRHKCEPRTEYALNEEEQVFVKSFRQIDDAEKQSIQLVMDNYNAKK